MNTSTSAATPDQTLTRLRGISDLLSAHTATLPVKAPARQKWVAACNTIEALLQEATGRPKTVGSSPAAMADTDTAVKWLRVTRGIDPKIVLVDCGYETPQQARSSGRTENLLRLEFARSDLRLVDGRTVAVSDVLPQA